MDAYHPASFDSAVERISGVLTYGFGGGSAYEPIVSFWCIISSEGAVLALAVRQLYDDSRLEMRQSGR